MGDGSTHDDRIETHRDDLERDPDDLLFVPCRDCDGEVEITAGELENNPTPYCQSCKDGELYT